MVDFRQIQAFSQQIAEKFQPDRKWINKAEGDFVTAERELQVQNMPNYDAVCFPTISAHFWIYSFL